MIPQSKPDIFCYLSKGGQTRAKFYWVNNRKFEVDGEDTQFPGRKADF